MTKRWGFDRSAAGARGVVNTSYSSCTRFRVLTALGIDTRAVAKTVYGLDVPGQSPFAFETGMRFERALTSYGAKYLFAQYVRAGRLSPESARLLDLEHEANALAMTRDLLIRRARGDMVTPAIIWQGALPSPIPGELIRPDLLVAGDGELFYRPGEVKSYEDRDGLTSDADLDSAASQAAVSLVALRSLEEPAYPRGAHLVDLILRAPSGMTPRLHTVSVERDVAIIEAGLRAFPMTEAHVARLLAEIGVAALDSEQSLETIPHRYDPSCHERCSLAIACKKKATAAGEFSRFGASIAESLAPYRTEGELAAAQARGDASPTLAHLAHGVAALDELLAHG